jgi:hypothetical protein
MSSFNVPKKPLNAYFLFQKNYLKNITIPSITDRSKYVQSAWQQLTVEEKQPLLDEYIANKIIYKNQIDEIILKFPDEYKEHCDNLKEKLRIKKEKKKRKLTDSENMPKKKKRVVSLKQKFSIYKLFKTEMRIKIKEENPNFTMIEREVHMSKMWKNMNDEQKQGYKDKSEVLIAEYKKNNDVEKVD